MNHKRTVTNLTNSPFHILTNNGPALLGPMSELTAEFTDYYLQQLERFPSVRVTEPARQRGRPPKERNT